jgi:hypothetical protein
LACFFHYRAPRSMVSYEISCGVPNRNPFFNKMVWLLSTIL